VIRTTFPAFTVGDGEGIIQTKVRAAFERCRDHIRFFRDHRKLLAPLVASRKSNDRFVWKDGDVEISGR